MVRTRFPIILAIILYGAACSQLVAAPAAQNQQPAQTTRVFQTTVTPQDIPTILSFTKESGSPSIPQKPSSTTTTVVHPDATLLASVKADLAARLAINNNQIALISITIEELPLDHLGCPEQAQASPSVRPALIIGKVLLLNAQGIIYRYHARGLHFIYCGSE